MRVMVLGAKGQLGGAFCEFLRPQVHVYPFSREELDITDLGALMRMCSELSPSLILNCAAYTQVDRAEEERARSYLVNALGARNVAFCGYKVGAKVVYFSTDYVFDGEKRTPYTEFDPPSPLSVYGHSKLWGEKFTALFNPDHLIIRVSWLYGRRGKNFVKTLVRLVKEEGKKTLRIVVDQKGTPTYAEDVVGKTWELVERNAVGLYHVTNGGETTWFHFAQEIVRLLDLPAEVVPIESSAYLALAKRPSYSVLHNLMLQLEGIPLLRNWQEALGEFLHSWREGILHG